MDYDRRNNGRSTFVEHYWFFVIATNAFIGSQVLSFITRFAGTPWIFCYAVAVVASLIGIGLIFYGKLPLYQQRRFFTFGSESIPESRRSFYIWGYRCVIFAVLLFLLLLLSNQ